MFLTSPSALLIRHCDSGLPIAMLVAADVHRQPLCTHRQGLAGWRRCDILMRAQLCCCCENRCCGWGWEMRQTYFPVFEAFNTDNGICRALWPGEITPSCRFGVGWVDLCQCRVRMGPGRQMMASSASDDVRSVADLGVRVRA
jgi:hypothetical protein